MKDLFESSQIFEASSRLQSAAASLRKIKDHQSLTPNERGNLRWSGRFLKEVDWSEDTRNGASVSGELSVQATDVRPSFYATLLHIQPVLRSAGIHAEDQLQQFLSATYHLLTAGGYDKRKQAFDAATIDLAATLLEELASALLIRLTGNGVPTDTNLYQLSIA
jgi:hypothetical protein